MKTKVHLDHDKEVGAYFVYVMTRNGCQEVVSYEYSDIPGKERGAMFAQAYQLAKAHAETLGAEIETNWC